MWGKFWLIVQEEKNNAKLVNDKIATAIIEEKEIKLLIDKKLKSIGNIVQADVPISKDEKENQVVRTWGNIPDLKVDGNTLGKLHHHEIMQCLNICEFDRGNRIAGHRGYYLRGAGVLLN